MKWIKKLDSLDVFICLASTLLVILAYVYAKQRIILADTAVYFATIVDSSNFSFSPRFIAVFSQIAPVLGVYLGFSLKKTLIAYSLNLILLPVASIILCRCVFKNKKMAIAILLFYTMLNSMLFYYPVSEFQMGLCLIFVLHAYFVWNNERKQHLLSYGLVCALLTVTIIFSHPLSILVFYVYLLWVFVTNEHLRKKQLILPALLPLVLLLSKTIFNKLFPFQSGYDESKMDALKNFNTSISTYFNSTLAKESAKILIEDYFVVVGMVVLALLVFIVKKKWIHAGLFAISLFSFWLLITVSFKDSSYNFYIEHQYQPIGFLVAFVCAYAIVDSVENKTIRIFLLLVIFSVSISKIVAGSRWLDQRLTWFARCIDLMHQQGIRKGVLSPEYVAFGTIYDYWASGAESSLLSSLNAPDSTVVLLVDWEIAPYNKDIEQEPVGQTQYFYKTNTPFVRIDSLVTKEQLERIKQVYD